MRKISQTKGQDGFTLIELIIVITLVGLVVASLVGIFGNPLKASTIDNSASQIGDHLRSIADGGDYYYTKTTTEATTMSNLTSGANATLKTTPVAPTSAKDADYAGTFAYVLDTTTYTAWNTTAADTTAVLAGLTDDVCKKINEKYAGLAADAAIPTAVDATKDMQCWKAAAATYATAVKVIYSH